MNELLIRSDFEDHMDTKIGYPIHVATHKIISMQTDNTVVKNLLFRALWHNLLGRLCRWASHCYDFWAVYVLSVTRYESDSAKVSIFWRKERNKTKFYTTLQKQMTLSVLTNIKRSKFSSSKISKIHNAEVNIKNEAPIWDLLNQCLIFRKNVRCIYIFRKKNCSYRRKYCLASVVETKL